MKHFLLQKKLNKNALNKIFLFFLHTIVIEMKNCLITLGRNKINIMTFSKYLDAN